MVRRNQFWSVLSKMRDKGGNVVGKEGICGDVGNGRLCGVCAKVRGSKRRGLRK
jgi:hypothetical protein